MSNFRLLLCKNNDQPWFSAYKRIWMHLSDVKSWAPWNPKPSEKSLATLKNPPLISSWFLLHNRKGGEGFCSYSFSFSLCCPSWARKIMDFYTRSQLQIWNSSLVDQLQRGNESSRDKSAWENLSSFPFSRDRFQKHMAFGCQLDFGICTLAESLFGLACFDAVTIQPTFLLINHLVILYLNQLWRWGILPCKD